MIKKILVRDYLKGYGDMTAEEREAFVGRVGEWLVRDGMRLLEITDRPMARSQSLMTITTRWTAEDCKAMTEGISLMSAMVAVADTWLPTQIYMRSAYRAVRQVYIILNSLVGVGVKGKADGLNVAINPIMGAPMLPPKVVTRGNGKTSETAARLQGKGWQGHLQPVPAMKKLPKSEQMTKHPGIEKGSGVALQLLAKSAAGAGAGKPQALPTPVGAGAVSSPSAKQQGTEAALMVDETKYMPWQRVKEEVQCAVMPVRPKHIDQYVHLLPKDTQERAAGYGELMRQLGEARDNMQLLMDDDHASAKSREQWAKQATRIDKKIRALREELDREWDKVAESGRVVIDDLGMAHLVPTSQCDAALNSTGADGEGGEREPAELTSEQRKRRRELRKWLIDLRRGKEGKDREKRIEQWRVNWQEYLTLEPKEKALEDEKILEAAKHFDINIEELKG